jgi:sensor histidine kinase YesM
VNLSLYNINLRTILSWYCFVFIINFILGFLFWASRIDDFELSYHIIHSLIGGFVNTSTVMAGLLIFNPKKRSTRFAVIILAVIIGSVISASFKINNPLAFYFGIILGILIGSIIYGTAFYWESVAITKSNLKREQLHRLQVEKQITEAKLRILQAQIEPHFLFNTLSNILNLFDTDIESGKSMQQDLIRYLESSLSKFRTDFTSIEEEIKLVTAYLNIFKVRMGDRLQFKTVVPDRLKKEPIPPMLIQPLVENAIKHGLEPNIDGGHIFVNIETENNFIKIVVSDTGLGMDKDYGMGTGLSNISERLSLLYGTKGRLTLAENSPAGLKAIIEVPYGEH